MCCHYRRTETAARPFCSGTKPQFYPPPRRPISRSTVGLITYAGK